MQNHTKVYFQHFHLTEADFVACEVCGAPSNSIHHVIPRSKFGSKRKHEQDLITNLVALCAGCHSRVHDKGSGRELNEKIKEIVKNRK